MKNFTEMLKELKEKCFLLFCDLKAEIVIVKEKLVKLDEPKNVLHVYSTDYGYTANYEEAVKTLIGMDKLYQTERKGKNLFIVNPIISGVLYHFCERIATKKALLSRTIKDKKNLDKAILKNIKCDLKNMNRFICNDLASMIAKDNPGMKFTGKNALSNFITVTNVEKGEIVFHTSKAGN